MVDFGPYRSLHECSMISASILIRSRPKLTREAGRIDTGDTGHSINGSPEHRTRKNVCGFHWIRLNLPHVWKLQRRQPGASSLQSVSERHSQLGGQPEALRSDVRQALAAGLLLGQTLGPAALAAPFGTRRAL